MLGNRANSKIEARNPEQIQMTKIRNTKRGYSAHLVVELMGSLRDISLPSAKVTKYARSEGLSKSSGSIPSLHPYCQVSVSEPSSVMASEMLSASPISDSTSCLVIPICSFCQADGSTVGNDCGLSKSFRISSSSVGKIARPIRSPMYKPTRTAAIRTRAVNHHFQVKCRIWHIQLIYRGH